MNGADQFYIFLICAAFGIFSGIIYDVFYCATLPFKRSWVKIVGDVAFSLVFIGLYFFVSLMFSFPERFVFIAPALSPATTTSYSASCSTPSVICASCAPSTSNEMLSPSQ